MDNAVFPRLSSNLGTTEDINADKMAVIIDQTVEREVCQDSSAYKVTG
jgi:hypothetical protein